MVSVESTGEKERMLLMFILQDRVLRFRAEDVMLVVLPPLLAFDLDPSTLPNAILPDGEVVEVAVKLAFRRDTANTESLLLCKNRLPVAGCPSTK